MKRQAWTVHSTRLWAILVAIASCFVALTQPGCTCRVGGEPFGDEYEDVLVPTSGYTGRSFAAQFRQVTSLEKGLIPASRVYTSPFDPRWLFIRDTVLATCGTQRRLAGLSPEGPVAGGYTPVRSRHFEAVWAHHALLSPFPGSTACIR